MKATGIVRRIDDLGRVVIPKEIRRTMRIREGDPLEIFTDRDGEIIFKKYSPIGELGDFAAQICDSLHRSTDAIAAVCDRDSIIAVSGASKRDFIDKRVSPALERVMESRGSVRYDGTEPIHVIDGDERYYVSVASPILSEGDILGCVIFVSQNASAGSDIEFKLAQTVASFLGKQMESWKKADARRLLFYIFDINVRSDLREEALLTFDFRIEDRIALAEVIHAYNVGDSV